MDGTPCLPNFVSSLTLPPVYPNYQVPVPNNQKHILLGTPIGQTYQDPSNVGFPL